MLRTNLGHQSGSSRPFSFLEVANGIEIWIWKGFSFGMYKLLIASDPDRSPAKDEAEALARACAAFLANPDC